MKLGTICPGTEMDPLQLGSLSLRVISNILSPLQLLFTKRTLMDVKNTLIFVSSLFVSSFPGPLNSFDDLNINSISSLLVRFYMRQCSAVIFLTPMTWNRRNICHFKNWRFDNINQRSVFSKNAFKHKGFLWIFSVTKVVFEINFTINIHLPAIVISNISSSCR